MDKITVKTNNVPRDIIDGFQLSADERKEFDYLAWDKIDAGEDSALFFRYRGDLYDLGNFMRGNPVTDDSLPAQLRTWDGYMSESAFSAIVVRYANDNESVIVGYVYS